MHDRRAIRSEHAEGGTIRGIARTREASRNAVRRALVTGARERYWRPSATEDAEPGVRDVLADYPHMKTSDVAVLIGWDRSYRALAVLVARIRPEYTEGRALRARPMSSLRRGRLVAVGTLQAGKVVRCGQARAGATAAG
ncbi:hypothetical protein [Tersicoccus sp. Bi-70]|uniref:hypothetical protein n=1 Tax=Tersicoccus sp. Bi-70 TaxID=1897634 RepID=UPI0009781FD5|nr:hypothetical protein [Tersicoccus sp. Bi-70]OMH30641.1 hypothetical protein BGP79_11830 [Tersicoccus sp. Bi-70]